MQPGSYQKVKPELFLIFNIEKEYNILHSLRAFIFHASAPTLWQGPPGKAVTYHFYSWGFWMKTRNTPQPVRSLALKPSKRLKRRQAFRIPSFTHDFSNIFPLDHSTGTIFGEIPEQLWDAPSITKRMSLWLIQHHTWDSLTETTDASWNQGRRDGKAEGWAKVLGEAIDSQNVLNDCFDLEMP